jgi:hypothetical protein
LDTVTDFPDCSSQNFATSSLGQFVHENYSVEATKGTYVFPNLLVDAILNLLYLIIRHVFSAFTL